MLWVKRNLPSASAAVLERGTAAAPALPTRKHVGKTGSSPRISMSPSLSAAQATEFSRSSKAVWDMERLYASTFNEIRRHAGPTDSPLDVVRRASR